MFDPTRCAVLMVLLLVGCSTEALHHDLDETDANDIAALLRRTGIAAHKVQESDGKTFAILVPSARFGDAVRLIEANQLPRPRYRGLEDLGRDQSLLRTPEETRAVESQALSGEISRLVARIPGVVDVTTVVALPDKNDLLPSDTRHGPSASVVVRYRPAADSSRPLHEGDVQRLVASAVPELALSPERVAVRVEPAPFPNPDPGVENRFEVVLGIRVAEESTDALKLTLLAAAFAVLLAATGSVWLLLRQRRARPAMAR